MPSKKAVILLAEDDENDFFLFALAVKKAGLKERIFHARDGQQAVDYIKGERQYGNRGLYPFPLFAVLDIKMPKLTGLEVLAWIKSSPEFSELPVIMLSGSDQAEDRNGARKFGADDYCVKPSSFADLVVIVRGLQGRWSTKPNSEVSGKAEMPTPRVK
jgi:DNA-binding response OmpR family regulator